MLEGRTALVTGSANGIGRAIVERFVADGAKVAAVDIDRFDAFGAGVVEIQFDLSETGRLEGLAREVEATVGPVDVLVNNAGIFEAARAVELTIESYRRVLAVNLDAPVFLAAHVGSRMAERGYGRIVNITSIHARFGEELNLAYDTAKGGLEQATRTLAIEFARQGILVNAVAPGFVQTRMSLTDGVSQYESDWFNDIYVAYGKLPLGRHAEPHEVAAHVAWLASDQNTYVTGQTLTVDGGVTVTI